MISRVELASSYYNQERNQERERLQEACGITAIFSKTGESISHLIPQLQERLQHRGRDAAGMASYDNTTGAIIIYKSLGKVQEVFPDNFDFTSHDLSSDRAIGHNRYGTSGDAEKDNRAGAQPVTAEWNGRTITIAYNGNLPESERQKLRVRIPETMPPEFNFDTVDIARVIVSAEGDSWEERIKNGLEGIHLAYALTILTDTGEVFGLVCPSGTWPLWVGETEERILFASETRVLDNGERIKWRPVRPGELVKATPEGVESTQIFEEEKLFRCALHDQYGARRDSQITENTTYSEFRRRLGGNLAREHPIDADLYVGIPETGLDMAAGFTEKLGEQLTYLITLLDSTRSFIGRNEEEINAVVNGKYAILHPEEMKDKSVALFDDSLIRGKTTGGDPWTGVKGVIGLVREAGACFVSLNLTLSKFVKGCDMGYYIREDQLIALMQREDGTYEELNEEAIAARIGADSVYFLSKEGVEDAYEWAFGKRNIACMGCMGELHPLEVISDDRAQTKKQKPALIYSVPLPVPVFVT